MTISAGVRATGTQPPAPRRRRWLVPVVLAALLAVAAVQLVAYVTKDAPPTSNPKQIAAAQLLVDGLATPAGATRDRYATACGIASSYCISAASLTPRAMVDGVVAELKTRGAGLNGTKCDPSLHDVLGLDCVADLRYHGAGLTVMASSTMADGTRAPNWLLVEVVDPHASTSMGQSKPLGTWQSLHLLPAGWHRIATCKTPLPTGCAGYSLTATVPSSYTQASAQLQASITAAGFRAGIRCYVETSVTRAHCAVTGNRYRTIGGKDDVLFIALLNRVDTGTSTLRLSVAPL